MRELSGYINCRTIEEQEMVLDIFEMLGYTWNEGQSPRGYRSTKPPMYYHISTRHSRRFGGQGDGVKTSAIDAKDLRNMWISLKRRQQ